jgi:hypothetical protein
MADVGSHHFVKGAHREVLVPQPSDDPEDPLNWSTTWKIATITSSALVTFSQGFGPLALAPMFPALMSAFKTDIAGAVQFTGVCILVLGFSNFIWYASCLDDRDCTDRPQGSHQLLVRPSARLHLITAYQFRQFDLARKGEHLRLLHGRVHRERYRCRTC